MRRKLAVLMLVALCLPAAAADAPKDAPKLDSHLAAAMDVMVAANAEHNIDAMIDAISDSVLGKVKAEHPTASDKTMAAFRDAFREEMKAGVPEVLKLQATVYAEHFSEADLKAVAAFYRSDTGKRFISEQPAIIDEITPLALRWGQETAMRAMQMAQDRLQREGMKL